jgi:hypothetical protein
MFICQGDNSNLIVEYQLVVNERSEELIAEPHVLGMDLIPLERRFVIELHYESDRVGIVGLDTFTHPQVFDAGNGSQDIGGLLEDIGGFLDIFEANQYNVANHLKPLN